MKGELTEQTGDPLATEPADANRADVVSERAAIASTEAELAAIASTEAELAAIAPIVAEPTEHTASPEEPTEKPTEEATAASEAPPVEAASTAEAGTTDLETQPATPNQLSAHHYQTELGQAYASGLAGVIDSAPPGSDSLVPEASASHAVPSSSVQFDDASYLSPRKSRSMPEPDDHAQDLPDAAAMFAFLASQGLGESTPNSNAAASPNRDRALELILAASPPKPQAESELECVATDDPYNVVDAMNIPNEVAAATQSPSTGGLSTSETLSCVASNHAAVASQKCNSYQNPNGYARFMRQVNTPKLKLRQVIQERLAADKLALFADFIDNSECWEAVEMSIVRRRSLSNSVRSKWRLQSRSELLRKYDQDFALVDGTIIPKKRADGLACADPNCPDVRARDMFYAIDDVSVEETAHSEIIEQLRATGKAPPDMAKSMMSPGGAFSNGAMMGDLGSRCPAMVAAPDHVPKPSATAAAQEDAAQPIAAAAQPIAAAAQEDAATRTAVQQLMQNAGIDMAAQNQLLTNPALVNLMAPRKASPPAQEPRQEPLSKRPRTTKAPKAKDTGGKAKAVPKPLTMLQKVQALQKTALEESAKCAQLRESMSKITGQETMSKKMGEHEGDFDKLVARSQGLIKTNEPDTSKLTVVEDELKDLKTLVGTSIEVCQDILKGVKRREAAGKKS